MVPKQSILDDMKQEAEEMFGDDAELDLDEEDAEHDYEEDRDDEQEENNDMEDGIDEDDDSAPKKSKGIQNLLHKRKRETEIIDDDDDFVR
jgi:hypothetical protein